ncbi:MAG: LutC/YkgG family protein [Vicinamibacteria bacterium]
MDEQSFLNRIRAYRSAVSASDLPGPPSPPKLSQRDLADRLSQELAAVGGIVHRVSSLEDARVKIAKVFRGLKARHIIRTGAPIFDEMKLDRALFEAGVGYRACGLKADTREAIRDAAFSAHAGLTAVDFGVAETGTLVLLARPAEGRAVSLVPPIHLGVLRARDIVLELGELFERVRARQDGLPSALTFVTGPSSTADIELVHTVGVHGPRELHLVLLD